MTAYGVAKKKKKKTPQKPKPKKTPKEIANMRKYVEQAIRRTGDLTCRDKYCSCGN